LIDQDETHWTRYLTTKLVCIPGGKPLLKLSVKQLATATLASTFLMFGSLQVNAAECGGNFSSFIKGVQKEALANGISKNAVNAALKNARLDKKVLSRDRAQGVFDKHSLSFPVVLSAKTDYNMAQKTLKNMHPSLVVPNKSLVFQDL
jgi:membrane-bound lytic murein transglycosylase B